MNDNSNDNDQYGAVVNEIREALCPVCDRISVSRRRRDDPDDPGQEIRWCDEGKHEFKDTRWVTAKPSEATRFD